MKAIQINLDQEKRIYFASDFHLGLSYSSKEEEIAREQKIIRWLTQIQKDAKAVFLVGDIFDFWFEYKQVVPKGYVRFLSKIADLIHHGIQVYFFTGNHDLWMHDYLENELGAKVFHHPIQLNAGNKKIFVGHGDGLGPGDTMYKILKRIFTNPVAQWFFRWLHPDIGVWLARKWSKNSRIKKAGLDEVFLEDREFLVQYCKKVEQTTHFDMYIFGHRHLRIDTEITSNSRYYNLGEWVYQCSFGTLSTDGFELNSFEEKS